MAIMGETYYGRHEPWMLGDRSLGYFSDAPYFPKPSHYADYVEPIYGRSGYGDSPVSRGGPSRSRSSIPTFSSIQEFPFTDLPPRVPARSVSSISVYSPFSEPPYQELPPRGGPMRSSSALPAYSPFPEPTFEELPPPRMPMRSVSAIPPYNTHIPDTIPRPTRSRSSISSYVDQLPREKRDLRPTARQGKVHPEIEITVPMTSSRTESKVRDAVKHVDGVTEVRFDKQGKVIVTGKVDPQVLLNAVRKVAKGADFASKHIYSNNFISFIQSKTGRGAQAEETTSSFSEHSFEEADNIASHLANMDLQRALSFREHPPSFSGRDDEVLPEPTFTGGEYDNTFRRSSYFNQHTPSYGDTTSFSYGVPRIASISSVHEELEEEEDTIQQESLVEEEYVAYEQYEPAPIRDSSYEEDYSYDNSPTTYRLSQSYGPSRSSSGYGYV